MKSDSVKRCWNGDNRFIRVQRVPSYSGSKPSTDVKPSAKEWLLGPPRTSDLDREPFPKENGLLEYAIMRSKFILDIVDPDDEEYIPYLMETWSRAISFLRRLAIRSDISHRDLLIPRIVPADAGSIDLLWKSSGRSMLINFQPGGEPATYYGKKPEILMSGVLYSDEPSPEILNWLAPA